MAIIYSYPPNSNILATDIIIGTTTALVGGKPKNQTKSFSIENLTNYIGSQVNITLNQVLTNGNTSILDAKIGELYLYDGPYDNYGKIRNQDDVFIVSRASNGTDLFYVDGGYSFTMNNGTAWATLINPLTTSRNYTLPDLSGTIALVSNLPVFSGTTNQVPKLNGYALVASSIYDDGVSVGVGTVVPDTCAKLQVDSTTQGFLPPRMNTAAINAIVEPADGLIVYNGETYQFYGFTGGVWKTFRMDTI